MPETKAMTSEELILHHMTYGIDMGTGHGDGTPRDVLCSGGRLFIEVTFSDGPNGRVARDRASVAFKNLLNSDPEDRGNGVVRYEIEVGRGSDLLTLEAIWRMAKETKNLSAKPETKLAKEGVESIAIVNDRSKKAFIRGGHSRRAGGEGFTIRDDALEEAAKKIIAVGTGEGGIKDAATLLKQFVLEQVARARVAEKG